MSATILLYIRQRYSSPLFPLLAAFLMLYARGTAWSPAEGAVACLLTLALLFWFRLYDDLASHRIDAGKPGRVYTEPGACRELRRLVVPLGAVLIACVLLIDPVTGALLAAWMLAQSPAYRFLFGRGVWRPLLPLLKYPVIALLLALGPGRAGEYGDGAIAPDDALACLALLPAFVLFESLDDPSYRLGRWAPALLLLAAHLLLLPAMGPQLLPLAACGLAFAAALVYAHRRIPGARYGVLLYFLLLRLWIIYAVQLP